MLAYSYCWDFDVGQTVFSGYGSSVPVTAGPLFGFVLHGNSINMPLCFLCLCLFDSHLRDSNRNCLGNISKIIQEVVCFCKIF